MITIVDYGDICIERVAESLKKITDDFRVSKKESNICNSDKIVLAGCGSAVTVMRKIQLLNLYSVLRVVKKPILGIGLGMQLMSDYSKEGNFPCLGFFPGTAVQFDQSVDESLYKGMHNISYCRTSMLFNGIDDETEFYFNNSFYLPKSELSTSTYFDKNICCASIENKSAYAVQFHPEMSGEAGLKLLQNFIEM
ncbi:MAG TPA: imidazole glycerol phosphate synthase subunit HisH [Ignavibacteriaceae bacterium]|jgi:glutamine amidotransferase|nr:MAG: Imidazole glycerol phosphate synthase subunit HisH 1 [Ignavibacteria bacterium ADurb.Bin266]OQY70447.1 MAG: imidazole glycerol phosphate synthase subunit HisH [Ignavibacteriales bacterium UTCHB2]HQF43650.1 imidazole glycerol phosphate synthase subunit HisH [Ignavibacteriaceae bacterium]HQI42242.1 imidazole glycerol phosphate synthase subunit HisH [Ignavibacteriaceae bacterium]HQJ45371.1 imidazole glycerol phosphate synthase subunit HisH [Ignavibacteriaceae bacterium]